eukprot:3349234-Ditylum_brightwellii.AAC.1
MEEASDGGMMYPNITHLSHKVGFKFLELPLPLLKEAFDDAEAVNPGLEKLLKQYVGHLSFPHNLKMIEGGIEPANQAHERGIGHESKLLRAQTAISGGIKVIDCTLNNRELLQTVVVASYKMSEEEALAIIGTK